MVIWYNDVRPLSNCPVANAMVVVKGYLDGLKYPKRSHEGVKRAYERTVQLKKSKFAGIKSMAGLKYPAIAIPWPRYLSLVKIPCADYHLK